VQLCLTLSAEGHRARVLADPAWWHGDPAARLAASRTALDQALRLSGADRLAPLADQLFEFVPAAQSSLVESFDRGFIWIGAGLDRPGVAVYLDARPFGREGAWDKAEQWLGGGPAVKRQLAGLRGPATVASIGFEGTDQEHVVGKLYFRLDRAVPLGELGTDLLGDPALAQFMVAVIGRRPMRLSGVVFSLGFDLGTGSVTDAKVDLCGHCLPYDGVAWAGLLQDLSQGFGLVSPAGVAADLLAGSCDVAFLGFGTGAAGQPRLNVYLRPPRDDSPVTARTRADRVRASCQAAVEYLRGLQAEGGWDDYRLPVGSSTQWVTGFAGLALAQAAAATGDTGARAAAEAAADWLLAHHDYPAGWGYNGQTGADADATAVAIRLLRLLGRPVPARDERWLLGHWRPEGGFATYDGPGCWGDVHPCVTAMAAMALDDATLHGLGDEMAVYLKRFGRADGTWPAYWWRGHHYSTFHHHQLLRRLGVAGDFPAPSPGLGLADDAPAFDLAYAAGTAWLAGDEKEADRLLTRLINDQRFDGGWRGAPTLRVTEEDCARPWEAPRGTLYPDLRGVMTTASAVLAFAAILGGDP
jgi:hypothetical protein